MLYYKIAVLRMEKMLKIFDAFSTKILNLKNPTRICCQLIVCLFHNNEKNKSRPLKTQNKTKNKKNKDLQ